MSRQIFDGHKIFLLQNLHRVFIKNGTVVNHDQILEKVDVCVEDGRIIFVGKTGNSEVPDGCRVIDASGKFVIPGGVDPHLHLELNMGGATTIDDFFHGTKAAIAGGTTTISKTKLALQRASNFRYQLKFQLTLYSLVPARH